MISKVLRGAKRILVLLVVVFATLLGVRA